MLYLSILKTLNKKKQLALLIDPDKHNENSLKLAVDTANQTGIDFILIGGSLISCSIDKTVEIAKKNSSIPVILFPGSLLQISDKADGILFLSIISGRNPEFLIGNHVIASPLIKKSNLEVIPTGYILIESGRSTSVEYMSNTKPIPPDKFDIAIATALAGEMLGHKLIYLEAGSGAHQHVNTKMISEVKKNINIPLIVGGGIKTNEDTKDIYKAGADIIVVGNSIENDLSQLNSMTSIAKEFKIQNKKY